jgi:hypothetical protein
VVIVVILGFVVVILALVFLAAYKMDAESFEVTTALGKIVSLSIKIISPRKRRESKE